MKFHVIDLSKGGSLEDAIKKILEQEDGNKNKNQKFNDGEHKAALHGIKLMSRVVQECFTDRETVTLGAITLGLTQMYGSDQCSCRSEEHKAEGEEAAAFLRRLNDFIQKDGFVKKYNKLATGMQFDDLGNINELNEKEKQ